MVILKLDFGFVFTLKFLKVIIPSNVFPFGFSITAVLPACLYEILELKTVELSKNNSRPNISTSSSRRSKAMPLTILRAEPAKPEIKPAIETTGEEDGWGGGNNTEDVAKVIPEGGFDPPKQKEEDEWDIPKNDSKKEEEHENLGNERHEEMETKKVELKKDEEVESGEWCEAERKKDHIEKESKMEIEEHKEISNGNNDFMEKKDLQKENNDVFAAKEGCKTFRYWSCD